MRFGLDIAQQRLSFAEVVARARFAEALGFDGIWGFDHFQPLYGEGPGECFEGYTTLAALATATERVRLGLLVTGLTYRPVSLLAAEAITIDHASNGRLELAIGTAWLESEHHELGIEFPPTGARVDLLDDSLQILRRVFTEDHVTHEGRQASVHDLTLLPRPVQSPLPIWVGASGEQRSLPLVAASRRCVALLRRRRRAVGQVAAPQRDVRGRRPRSRHSAAQRLALDRGPDRRDPAPGRGVGRRRIRVPGGRVAVDRTGPGGGVRFRAARLSAQRRAGRTVTDGRSADRGGRR